MFLTYHLKITPGNSDMKLTKLQTGTLFTRQVMDCQAAGKSIDLFSHIGSCYMHAGYNQGTV